MKKDKELIEGLEPMNYYTKEDLCGDCKYRKSFLCDKRYAYGIVETYYNLYNIKIYVFEFHSNNLRDIIDQIHTKELKFHRNGSYYALKATNFHCGESCECECSSERCWEFERVPSRRQPHCIKFFGLKLPEKYQKKNIAFILGKWE